MSSQILHGHPTVSFVVPEYIELPACDAGISRSDASLPLIRTLVAVV